jgi:hypothetical protein
LADVACQGVFFADMAPSTPRKLPEMTKIPLLSSSSSQVFFHGGLPLSRVASHRMPTARPRHDGGPPMAPVVHGSHNHDGQPAFIQGALAALPWHSPATGAMAAG